MAWCAATQRWTLHRTMFPGRYQFKFVMDEAWSASADHLTMLDGDNVNNYINVMARVRGTGDVMILPLMQHHAACM